MWEQFFKKRSTRIWSIQNKIMAARERENTERRIIFSNRHEQIQQEIQVNEIDRNAVRRTTQRENRLSLLRRITDDGTSRETGLHPFSRFPFPFWNLIFERLTKSADLLACMGTCTQLDGMLRESRTKFLFKEVFGFLADKLSFHDILNCRRVCKKWKFNVDKVFDDAYIPISVETRANTPFMRSPIQTFALKCPYTFHIGLSNHRQNDIYERRRNALRSFQGNPLLGKRVCIKVWFSTPDGRDLMEPMVKEVLSDFEAYLLHVEIEFFHMSYHPRQYWDLICHVLNVCQSLRTFSLCNWSDTNEFQNLTDNELNFSLDEMPLCPSLESIQMCVVWQTDLTIQDTLIRKYSNQLKILNVSIWHDGLYQQLPWENLRCLGMEYGRSIIAWERPMTMDAPMLEELCLKIDDFNVIELREVMRVINYFPGLTTCTFKFSGGSFGFGGDMFLNTEHVSELMYSNRIICLNLHLRANRPCNPSFDFLIFFPYVERLNIETTEWHSVLPLRSFIRGERPHDFVQLAQYISAEFWNRNVDTMPPIYRSNIWEVLTRLQYLGIARNNQSPYGSTLPRFQYNRSAYEASRI